MHISTPVCIPLLQIIPRTRYLQVWGCLVATTVTGFDRSRVFPMEIFEIKSVVS